MRSANRIEQNLRNIDFLVHLDGDNAEQSSY